MIETFKDITQGQADLIKSFAIFYLLLVGNYVGSSIFTCSQIKYINNHKWIQMFIAFFLLYFLVTLVSETGKLEFTPPIEKLIYSIFYFIGFIIVMRLDMRITALVLFLIFLIYFLELNKDFYLEGGSEIDNQVDQKIYNEHQYWITLEWPFKIRLFKVKPNDFEIINKIERIIYYIILFLLIIGFIGYGGEIKDTLHRTKNLTWYDIIMDTKICRIKDRESFLHYLKVGLGLKL
jgi:hypothetical protein